MSQPFRPIGGLKSAFYDFARFFQRYAGLEKEWRRGILRMLERNEAARLLDCGCYQGEFTMMAAAAIGTNRVSGIDVLEAMQEEVERRGIAYHHGNLEDRLPFEDKSFDVVCANQIIEHLSNTDNFIKEIYRILTDGGYAVISTPNLAAGQNIVSLLLGQQPLSANVSDEVPHAGTWLHDRNGALNKDPEISHRRLFTLGALKDLMQYHGFTVEARAGSGFFPFPAVLARLLCLIDRWHAIIITVKIRKENPGRERED
jgi:SAM-dependent methyltransferase